MTSHQQSDHAAADPATDNPYAPTLLVNEALPVASGDEQIRRQYLAHEVSVKSIGQLFLVGALIFLPTAVLLVSSPSGAEGFTASVILIAVGLLYLTVGYGIYTLQEWARWCGILLSVIGLSGVPIGTIICGYFLYLLASKKGRYVFTEEYQRIRAATPHVRYQTPLWLWCLLGFVILLVIGVIVGVMG
jgi:hypothetical protein